MTTCPKCGHTIVGFKRRSRPGHPRAGIWEAIHRGVTHTPHCKLDYSDVLQAYTVADHEEAPANEHPALRMTS